MTQGLVRRGVLFYTAGMKKARDFLLSEMGFVIAVVVIGMFLSLYPMFYELARRNDIFPDRQFVLVYNFAPDYNAYLSKITQGIQGHFLVREYFTSEAHLPSLLQVFYVLLGRIGGLFSPNPEVAYHLGRIGFGLGWILAGWFFIKFTFANKLYRKLAFLLFVFGGNFPKIVPDQAGYGFAFLGQKWEQSMVGWSNLDPVRRMTFIPHWNAGHVMTVLSLLCLIKFLSHLSSLSNLRNLKYLGLSIVFGIFAGLILPPTLIIVYLILGFWFLYYIFPNLLRSAVQFFPGSKFASSGECDSSKIVQPPRKLAMKNLYPRHLLCYLSENKHLLICLFTYLLITFTTLVYNLWITQIYPWKALVETDLYVNKIVFPYWNYLVALGPVGFLGLAGAILVLFLHKEKYLWSSFWVLGMFVLIIFFDKAINWHDQTRFLEVGPELPLSILTVVLMSFIFGIFGKYRNSIMIFFTCLMMVMAGFLSVISIKAQNDFIDHKILGSYPPLSFGNYVVYPVKSVVEAINWLKINAHENDVILSGTTTGNHIPPYAGKYVYVGHGSQTVRYYPEKLPRAIEYYQGKINEENSLDFLRKNRITYVFYGPEEKTLGDYPVKAGYLMKAYEKKDVTIYKVK